MPRGSRKLSSSPWGYLLPLRDEFSPMELVLDKTALGTDNNCELRVNAEALGLTAFTTPRCFIRFHHSKTNSKTTVSPGSDWPLVRVDGAVLRRGREHDLKHGERIAIGTEEETYEFVSRDETDTFKAPPDVLERYFVGRKLGSGGFGKVYILFHKKWNYRHAMKIIELRKERHKYAKREADILKTLKHPCVIETHGVKLLGTQHIFLITEYLAGGDLSHFVKDNCTLTEAQTKLLFFQLVLAVRYLHRNKVVHRDLKPENILLQQREPRTLIKVTDFGLAKKENEHSSLKTFAGTKPFLAPEIVNNETYTNAVDIWSMGVILHYSLTGTLPFRTLNEAISRNHRVKYDPILWSAVSLSAKRLVEEMLKVEARMRVSVTQVMGFSWLDDDAMREDAYQLTNLTEIKPPVRAPARAAAPPVQASSVPPRVPFRMQYTKVDTEPERSQQSERGCCVQALRARPLLLSVSVIICLIVVAGIIYGLWQYFKTS